MYSLWILSLLWFIYRNLFNAWPRPSINAYFWMKVASTRETHTHKMRMRQKNNNNYKHWTEFFVFKPNILFTFRYFIAHMLDTQLLLHCHCWCCFVTFIFVFLLSISELNNAKKKKNGRNMNERIKVTISDFFVVQFFVC